MVQMTCDTHLKGREEKNRRNALPRIRVRSAYRKLACCTHSFHAGYMACACLLAATVSVSYTPTRLILPLNASPKLLARACRA
jgi:hypothetical protein